MRFRSIVRDREQTRPASAVRPACSGRAVQTTQPPPAQHRRRATETDGRSVLADSTVVGRIMKAAAAPVGAPWLWTQGKVLTQSFVRRLADHP